MITTVSRSLAQQIVNTVHDICGHDINFINKKGIIFASTDEHRIGTFHEIGKEAALTQHPCYPQRTAYRCHRNQRQTG